MIIYVRFISNIIISIGYLIFSSKIDNLLKTLIIDPRTSIVLQGLVWLVITLLINSITSRNPKQYLHRRLILIGFLFVFVYYLGTGIFNNRLFTIANLEAYWFSFMLVNLGMNIARIRNQRLPITSEDRDIVIYYLWMMFFVFFIAFPSLFVGPVLGVCIGPLIIIVMTIYTNKSGS